MQSQTDALTTELLRITQRTWRMGEGHRRWTISGILTMMSECAWSPFVGLGRHSSNHRP